MSDGRLPHGELEGVVMDVLWDSATPLVPQAVRDRLDPGRPLAYTTVMTILVRLCDKGLVEREKVGRAYAYRPRQSREERTAQRMGELLAATDDASVVLARFVESLTPEQAAQLRQAVDAEAGAPAHPGGHDTGPDREAGHR